MSAFLINPDHIGQLAFQMEKMDTRINSHKVSAQAIAEQLAIANWQSIEERYGEVGFFWEAGRADYIIECVKAVRPNWRHTPIAIIKMAHCFSYQSCESVKWYQANYESDYIGEHHMTAFVHRMIGKIDGYNDAAWEYRAPAPIQETVKGSTTFVNDGYTIKEYEVV